MPLARCARPAPTGPHSHSEERSARTSGSGCERRERQLARHWVGRGISAGEEHKPTATCVIPAQIQSERAAVSLLFRPSEGFVDIGIGKLELVGLERPTAQMVPEVHPEDRRVVLPLLVAGVHALKLHRCIVTRTEIGTYERTTQSYPSGPEYDRVVPSDNSTRTRDGAYTDAVEPGIVVAPGTNEQSLRFCDQRHAPIIGAAAGTAKRFMAGASVSAEPRVPWVSRHAGVVSLHCVD